MTDELRAYAGPGPFEPDHEGFKAPTWQELRDLADHNFRLYADAFARAEKAEQECRDRECTERDVRARLADAENALARVRDLERQLWAETEDIKDPGNTVRLVCRHILAQFRAALDGTS